MARRWQNKPLDVYLNSRLVGQLRRQLSGAIQFQYSPGWLEWPSTLPISLSLPLREEIYTGAPVSAVFDNLLPDNDSIRRQIATRVHAPGIDAYSLLAALGHDCVGAMQFLSEGYDPGPAGVVQGTPVDDLEISTILANLGQAPLGITEDLSFRISIAGAQEKTALLFWKGHWHRPHGATATTHIFKPSIGRVRNELDLTHSVENEYLCLQILQGLGLPTAQARMATFGERRVLIVERFDRRWTQDGRLLRLPQEDCCQALSVPSTQRYESEGGPGAETLLRFLRGSDTPAEDQQTFLKAIIAFWLLGATDGHAKNFSVFLSPGGRYRLTPLYDVLSVQPNVDSGQIAHNQFRVAMAAGNNRRSVIDRITPRYFLETAAGAGIGFGVSLNALNELRDITSTAVETALINLPSDFPEYLATSIQSGVRRRLRILQTQEAV